MDWIGPTVLAAAMLTAASSGVLAEIPELLRSRDGTQISAAQAWEIQRRPEILELFRTHVYGRAPIDRPSNLRFEIEREKMDAMDGAATLRQIAIRFAGPGGDGTIHLTLFVPNRRPNGARVPAFLFICNRGKENIDPTREKKSAFWPAEAIIARGYAAATFHYGDVALDRNEGLKSGVFSIYGDPAKPREPDAWGAISAWAWGASRALDYLQTDFAIDANKVAVVGHSRGGKTALWAGAQDTRFAMAVSNDSGCTGAAIARGKRGERIEQITKTFPYWFCPNYPQYAGREEDLPLDQHMLIAAVAPRLAYVASAAGDDWADPASEFRGAVLAAPAWGFYGRPALAEQAMPAVNTPLHDAMPGYHIRPGGHDLTEYDWQRFMDYADKWLR